MNLFIHKIVYNDFKKKSTLHLSMQDSRRIFVFAVISAFFRHMCCHSPCNSLSLSKNILFATVGDKRVAKLLFFYLKSLPYTTVLYYKL